MDTEAQVARLRASLVGKQGLQGLWANKRLLWIAVVIALAGINYGYEQGSYAQVLVMRSFSDSTAFGQISSDPTLKGWTVSILPLGGWLGALLNGYAINRLGRRGAIFAGGFFCLVGGVITTAAMGPDFIFAGRFFIGFAVGILSAAAPTYLSEIAPPEIRGTVVGLFQLATTVGILISYWIGYGTNYISATSSVSWRIPFAVQILSALGLMVGVWLCPETPRHLMNIGQEEKALEIVAYVRKRDVNDELVQIEYLEIKAEAMFEHEILARRYPQLVGRGGLAGIKIELYQMSTLVSDWSIFKRTAAGCLTMFFQQWTGIDAVVNYAPTIFSSIGLDGNTTSLLATGVLGVINVIFTMPALQWIDSLGRRSLLLIGTSVMMTCMILLAALSASFGHDWDTHVAASWVAVACIWIYIAGFAVSWGPCSFCLISEVFPLSVRGPGAALSASTNWMNNFAIALFVPTALENIEWKTYIIFIATLALGALWVIFILPETRNKTLEEMDLAFGSRTGTEDSARMAEIQDQIGLTARLSGMSSQTDLYAKGGEVEHRDEEKITA